MKLLTKIKTINKSKQKLELKNTITDPKNLVDNFNNKFDQAEKSENLNTSHFKLSIKNIHVQNNIILSFNL